MKKILLVSSLYPTEQSPGYGIFVKNCERGLIENGFKVDKAVIARTPSNILYKAALYLLFYFDILFKGFFSGSDLIYAHFISHSCLPLYLISLFREVKIAVNIHGGDVFPEGRIRKLAHRLFLKRLIAETLQKADLIITPSREYKRIAAERYGARRDKIFVSPSGGVKPETFAPADKKQCRKTLGIGENDFVAGYVSRLEESKGCGVLAEAAGIVKKSGGVGGITYMVVGNGSMRKNLDEATAGYGLEKEIIRFEKAEQEKLRYYYSAMDVFIFPTLKESLGLVGIEAMACGVPVIGSRLGALGEYIIEGRTGFFFNPGDAEDLASKIKSYYRLGPELRSKISDNAIKMAANFDSAAVACKLSQKFKQMLEAETNEKRH